MALTWGGALIGEMNTVFQLVQAMFSSMGETWRQPKPDYRTVQTKAEEKRELSATPIVVKVNGKPVDHFAGEIHRLEEALGHPLENGACIDFKLQDLLQIIPRKRRRIDAYCGLVRELVGKGISLTITSNKTKIS